MVKGSKKFKTLNKLEKYLNEVLANPRSPRGDFKIFDNALENLYTRSKDESVNIRELYNDAMRTKKFKDLKFLLSEWLASRVSRETVVVTIVIADELKDENLKIKALKFIHNNIDVIQCKQWEELQKYNHLKDEVYFALLTSLFKQNQELSQKVSDMKIELIKSDQYELPIKKIKEEEELLDKQSFIEEPSNEELFIGELSIEESFIGELSIDTPSNEGSLDKEHQLENLSIEETVMKEPSIDELFIGDLLNDDSINEKLSIEKLSIHQEADDDLPITSSKDLNKSATTAEMSLEDKIEDIGSPHMVNIGVLNHSLESEFQSYVSNELSEDELKQPNVKTLISCDENNSTEDLYTSFNTHFIPIKTSRLLYIKKINVNSIEKHAFKDKMESDVPCSPITVISKFNTILPASESNSSQSLCSNLTELLINTCAHNLVTACEICRENRETETKKEENANDIMADKDLPIDMFIKNKTSKLKGQNDLLSWVEHSSYLTKEKRLAKQKFEDLEAKVALVKDKWNEEQQVILPDQDDKDFFNSKLDKAFNDLITVRSNFTSRHMPVQLDQNLVYNSFQDLKQKAERRFEMLQKGIHIPANYVFDAIPTNYTELFNAPIDTKSDDVSHAKFFPQNKNIKFFKSNQRRSNCTGQYNYF